MKLLLNRLIVFVALCLFWTQHLSSKELKAWYKLEIGGINIGDLEWHVEIKNENYKTSMFLKDKGIVSGLYKFKGKYLSEGKVLGGVFIPSKYTQQWETRKKTRNVEIFFDKTFVSKINLYPKEDEAPRIDYLNIGGLADPLSSLLNIINSRKNNYTTIDGRRLYKMTLDLSKTEKKIISKRIIITDYLNIWADHKRKDLKYIIIKQDSKREKNFFPIKIEIKNKGFVFKLTEI